MTHFEEQIGHLTIRYEIGENNTWHYWAKHPAYESIELGSDSFCTLAEARNDAHKEFEAAKK